MSWQVLLLLLPLPYRQYNARLGKFIIVNIFYKVLVQSMPLCLFGSASEDSL